LKIKFFHFYHKIQKIKTTLLMVMFYRVVNCSIFKKDIIF